MTEIKVGDRVRVKDRPDWPSPPGYRLANSEGTVIQIWEENAPEHAEIFNEYVEVKLEKTESSEMDISHSYNFRREALEKI